MGAVMDSAHPAKVDTTDQSNPISVPPSASKAPFHPEWMLGTPLFIVHSDSQAARTGTSIMQQMRYEQ
ncbi:hypothetical protein BDR07DRAFT_1412822 [Suillus spraguei]|nr:hypothetical protein BDR07DRAFT_1412822 [Suillus spraguei]